MSGERRKTTFYINKRDAIDYVVAVLPNGQIGTGETTETAQFNAVYFPTPEATAPTEERGWRELRPDEVEVFSKPRA